MCNLTDEIINVLNNTLIGEGGTIFCDLEKGLDCVNCGGEFQSIPNLGTQRRACPISQKKCSDRSGDVEYRC
jgi:hypothetical protein